MKANCVIILLCSSFLSIAQNTVSKKGIGVSGATGVIVNPDKAGPETRNTLTVAYVQPEILYIVNQYPQNISYSIRAKEKDEKNQLIIGPKSFKSYYGNQIISFCASQKDSVTTIYASKGYTYTFFYDHDLSRWKLLSAPNK